MKMQTGTEPKFKTKNPPESEPALKELFTDGIRDLYWAENHLVKALPKMQKAASSPKLAEAIGKHLEQTKEQVVRLEKIFELLKEQPIAKKCDAMEGITLEGEELVESTEEGTSTRDVAIILASQKVEHYEIASYAGLIRLGNTLGLKDAANLLAETLEEEKKSDDLLTEIAENEVNHKANKEA